MKTSIAKVFGILTGALLLLTTGSQAQDETWFYDATTDTGLEGVKGFRINIVDINNDDYPDLLLDHSRATLSKRDPDTRMYLNLPNPDSNDPMDRVFTDITDGSGIFVNPDEPGESRVIDIATMADVNNDGNIDLVTGTYYDRIENFLFPDDRCEVLLGDGSGKFTLVENNGLHELGLLNVAGFTFLDYDLDGNLDLYIATWFADRTNNRFDQDYLMKGAGDGTFTNVSDDVGISNTQYPIYGVSSTDWNNDGWPDIFTSAYCRSDGSLWKNINGSSFFDVARSAGYSAQHMGGDFVPGQGVRALCQWAALPADFDNDGDMDIAQILVHGGLDPNEGRSVLAVNSGPSEDFHLDWDLERFERAQPAAFHLGDMDGAWLDIDNDARLDFTIAQNFYVEDLPRTYFLRQNDAGYFDDITADLGLLDMKESHNIRAFDYDLDGDMDLLVELLGEHSSQVFLLENRIGNQRNHLAVKLLAPPSVNADAVGARITVYAGGVAQIREVQSGQGHFGAQRPLIQNFGLADFTGIDSVVVRWPGQDIPTSVVVNPPLNQMLVIDGTDIVISVVENEGAAAGVQVYPNPTSGLVEFNVPTQLAQSTVKIELISALGVVVRRYSPSQVQTRIRMNIRDLAAGRYQAHLHLLNGEIVTAPLVKY